MPIQIEFKDGAVSTLANAISATDDVLYVSTGDGGKFPDLSPGHYFYCVLIGKDNVREVVKVTSRSLDIMGIERAQDGTTAVAFRVLDRIELRVTNQALVDIANASPDGTVIQVLYVIKKDSYSTTIRSWRTITDLSVSIVPKFSTSKMLILASIAEGSDDADHGGAYYRLARDGVGLSVGDSIGSNRFRAYIGGSSHYVTQALSSKVLIDYHSPGSTDSVTYSAQILARTYEGIAQAAYVNYGEKDEQGSASGVSTITVMEISA